MAPPPPPPVEPAPTVRIDWPEPGLYPSDCRDPMAFVIPEPEAPAEAVEEAPALLVKGIVFGEDGSFAIIGPHIAAEGDTIEGTTISRISRSAVEFTAGDRTWTQTVETGKD